MHFYFFFIKNQGYISDNNFAPHRQINLKIESKEYFLYSLNSFFEELKSDFITFLIQLFFFLKTTG